MVNREEVLNLIEEKLGDNLFLVDLDISSDGTISVVIDGDEGVTVSTCIDISRQVENNLDREKEDFALTVASAGLDRPLTLKRQYVKNIGRSLKVNRVNGAKIEGLLTKVEDDHIVLETKTKERLENRKKKIEVITEHEIMFEDISKALVVIVF